MNEQCDIQTREQTQCCCVTTTKVNKPQEYHTMEKKPATREYTFSVQADQISGFHIRSVLCVPIWNSNHQIIGVAQVLNRLDGKPFDDADQRLFEAFVIFCGLGINNTIMYDQVKKSWAKQSVALD
ncbi:hypothetical protein STEG23_018002, partial [Scotinomys teguina]